MHTLTLGRLVLATIRVLPIDIEYLLPVAAAVPHRHRHHGTPGTCQHGVCFGRAQQVAVDDDQISQSLEYAMAVRRVTKCSLFQAALYKSVITCRKPSAMARATAASSHFERASRKLHTPGHPAITSSAFACTHKSSWLQSCGKPEAARTAAVESNVRHERQRGENNAQSVDRPNGVTSRTRNAVAAAGTSLYSSDLWHPNTECAFSFHGVCMNMKHSPAVLAMMHSNIKAPCR